MIFTVKSEQTFDYSKRIKYDARTDSFMGRDSAGIFCVGNVTQPFCLTGRSTRGMAVWM